LMYNRAMHARNKTLSFVQGTLAQIVAPAYASLTQ